MRKAVKATIIGRVQGVGYRYFASREANLLGLSGYVKNLYDGNVEVFVQGEDESLARFIEILKQGPRFGGVTNVEVEDFPQNARYTEFTIEY